MLAAATLAATSSGIALYSSMGVSNAAEAGSTVVFRDDFNGSGLPSSSWQIDEGRGYPGGPQNGFGTDEIETVTKDLSNLRQANGNLYITPIRDGAGNWTSARIESKQVFKPAAGQVMHMESALSLPDVHGAEAAGYWPAWWALGASNRDNAWTWPASGEFDMMESVNGVDKIWSTLHCGYAAQWGGPCGEPSGISNGGLPVSNPWGTKHTYGVEWDRTRGAGNDQLRWYVDGNVTLTVNQTDPRMATVWDSMTIHNGYFIILNVAMGGQFPAALGGGPTAATKSGVPMIVDYVEVSLRGAGSSNTTTTKAPGTTTSTTRAPGTTTTTHRPTTTTSRPTTTTSRPTTTSTTTRPTTTTTPAGSSSGVTGLRATTVSASHITLSWNAVAGATKYTIYRAGVPIATSPAPTYDNDGLIGNLDYIYSVSATLAGGGETPQSAQIIVHN